MADSRFFNKVGSFSLAEIAKESAATILHPEKFAETEIKDVAPLDRATASNISFLDNSKYITSFENSSAGAFFVRERLASKAPDGMILLISDDPYRCYARTSQLFYPFVPAVSDISPTSIIDKTAVIGDDCSISPGAVIGKNVKIADNVTIGANAVIHDGVTIGKNSRVGALSSISHADLSENIIIHRGVHIGQDGFGFSMGKNGHIKVPQLGRVIIGNDVEIGAGTCVDRGAGPDTVIGDGTKIDNLVQIGHNVQIGKNVIIVSQVGISGSTRIGDGTTFAGQSGAAGHLKIGAGVKVAAKSGVINDVASGVTVGGFPAIPIKDWHRQSIALTRLARKRQVS